MQNVSQTKNSLPQPILNLSLEELLSQGKITEQTFQKVISAKKCIERKYNMIKLKKSKIIFSKKN